MQKVKWLYAAVFALSCALIVEWTGSFTVQRNLSWFFGLSLPVFWLDATMFTALYSAATALEAFVVSDALVKGAVNPTFGLYASVKFSSALFLALFFAARNPLLGLVTMTVTLALMWIFCIFILRSRAGKLAKAAVPVLLLWYSSLWSLSYAGAIINSKKDGAARRPEKMVLLCIICTRRHRRIRSSNTKSQATARSRTLRRRIRNRRCNRRRIRHSSKEG